MTFSSKIMPNEALDPNSLVGSMLNAPEAADGVETACGSQLLVTTPLEPRGIRAIAIESLALAVDSIYGNTSTCSSLLPGNHQSATLCQRMAHAYINFDGNAVESMAEVLKVVRDYLLPAESEPARDSVAWHRWDERNSARVTLTAQIYANAIKP